MSTCAVYNCKSRKKQKGIISFHPFPLENVELRNAWINALHLEENWKPNLSTVICSKHFEKEYFSDCILSESAIPTIFGPNNLKKHCKPETLSITNNIIVKKDDVQDQLKETNDKENPELKIFNSITLKSCRICIINKGAISIYSKATESISIAEKIQSFTNIIITQDDILPNLICLNCEEKVHESYKLKIVCEKSNKLLKNLFENSSRSDLNLKLEGYEDETEIFKTENEEMENEENKFCSIFLPEVAIIENNEDQLNQINILKEDDDTLKSTINVQKNKKINKKQPKKSSQILSEQYKCEVCEKFFKKHTILLEHLKIHGDEMPYECDICPKKYKLKSSLHAHKRRHIKEKIYTCEICSAQYKFAPQLKIHKLKHEPPKFKCDECGKMFTNHLFLSKHKKRHEGKRVSCDKCDKTFANKDGIKLHEQSFHMGIKNHKCIICEKEFFNTNSFKSHMKIHTGEKSYKCGICNEDFYTNTQLSIHFKKHTGEKIPDKIKNTIKIYECKYCNKILSNSFTLQNHMRLHNGDNRYECHICKKVLVSSHTLDGHLRIHSGEKPFKCKFCPDAFKYVSNLIVHQRKHTGIKPQVCKICEKVLHSIAHLKVHMRKHTGEKPFQCPYCDKKFTVNGSLTIHIRIHKGQQRFPCKQCEAKYDRASHLRAHIKQHHEKESEIIEEEILSENLQKLKKTES